MVEIANSGQKSIFQTWGVKFQVFYNRYFPTDRKTYVYRVPILGFILSLLSWEFIRLVYHPEFQFFYLSSWAILTTSLACSCDLHYGLKENDHKHLSFWIIFKVIELLTSFITITVNIASRHNPYCDYVCVDIYLWYSMGYLVTFINMFNVLHVARRCDYFLSKDAQKEQELYAEPSIYDGGDQMA